MKKILVGVGALIGLAAIFFTALPTLLHAAGLHPVYEGASVDLPGKRALIITTSHSVLAAPGETEGPETGVMASEFTHPYYSFIDAGIEVDMASIQGGVIPIDPQTLSYPVASPEDKRYLNDPIAQTKVQNSIAIADVDIGQYDIVFISGGWGAAYDLAQTPAMAEKVSEAFYGERTAVIGGVCHGVLGLINARDEKGSTLISGRRMTGVSDKQIRELGIEMTPLHPETELRRAGALYESQTAFRDIFATHVVVDDEQRFVTGQNQNSGLETAHRMMQVIADRG
ncbi:MAG: type 1 glutamine amidotransferase domain-containing protein [Halieaceae bacterium]|nr:type 1 glutamine amidotransferase domain-containing protein [Halieaceae bacterium]